MKFERNPKYTTIAIYVLLVLAAAMILFESFRNIGIVVGWGQHLLRVLQPFINGLVFAFLLNPLLRAIDDRLLPRLFPGKINPARRRGIALVITYLITLTVIVLFVSMVFPQIVKSLVKAAENLEDYFLLLEDLYANILGFINSATDSQDTEVRALVSTLLSAALDALENLLASTSNYLSGFMRTLLTATQRITSGILNFFLGIIVSVYLLFDREKLFAQVRKLATALLPNKTHRLVLDIAKEANRILSGFVVGKLIDSLIIGVLCFVGMSILRMGDYAAFISVIVGITNVIPYFGPFIGAIPSAIILFVNSPIQALWFIIFIFLLQQFDGNILGPKILGDTIGLSALWVMFAIILFSGLFGIPGMFIGVPLFAIIYSLMKRFIAYLLGKKGKPLSTREYATKKNPLIK